jgi:hypothetical protein
LLQALAYDKRGQKGDEEKALTVLSEAVHLGEVEGFIRSFVDEGPVLRSLLTQLRARQRRTRSPTLAPETMSYLTGCWTPLRKRGRVRLPPGGSRLRCRQKARLSSLTSFWSSH